jgi:hypothetical protein
VDVFGYDRDELTGELLNDLIVPDWFAEEAARLDERTQAGEVTWTAERFGGELSFGESDLGGNSVRVRLQASDSG